MKTKIMRAVSLMLVVCVLTGYVAPSAAFATDLGDRCSLENGSVNVTVRKSNGGFVIRTVDGDVFNKDDNNKDLLFHRSDYDTSFTSFKVTYSGGDTRYYVFGGDYGYRGESSTEVNTVEVGGTAIQSAWSVGQLTFIQTIQPVWATEMNEHGTVAIHYLVQNNTGAPVTVEARLLLDTALGDQDFGYYEVTTTQGQAYERITSERTITGDQIPANFFAYNDYENPSITAYTVNDTAQDGIKPYQVTFAHWNNLAATEFEYTPQADLTFTNKYNAQYLTADSAYALYYDLGTVGSGGQAEFHTYYGIYSNVGVAKGNKFSVNITSPTNLALTADKKNYEGTYSPTGGEAPLGTFKVTTNIGNIVQPGAQDYRRIAIAAYPDNGITALDTQGNLAGSYANPYSITIDNFSVGEVQQLVWGFKASVASTASYRRINFRVYDMPDSANGALLLENVIGSGTCYVLCPGGDGKLPEITFTSASPQMLYFEGTRHYYLTGNQLELLKAPGNYMLRAQKKDDPATSYVIPYSNILFSEDQELGTVIDVTMTEKYELGEYDLVFDWTTPPAGVPQKLTAPALRFTVTDDKSYKNDYYGIVAVVKTRPVGSAATTCTYDIQAFPGEVQYDAFKKPMRKDSTDDTVFDAAKTILFEIRGEFTLQKDANGDISSATAVSSDESKAVNINGVLDVINGKVNIARASDNGTPCVFITMTGELLTSYSRTLVWTGDAAITPLTNGRDYGLIAYDDRGDRPEFESPEDQKWPIDNKINLMWSSEYKILQTIAGMVCDLRYGQFGFMHDDDDLFTGYILSFGATLDISALMPGGKDDDSLPAPPRLEDIVRANDAGMSVAEWKPKNPEKDADDENEKDKTKPVGKVNIKDILYGLNQGYIGFNAEAEVMLPKYTDALPELGGRLAINTIGGYYFEVEGKTKTEVFELEFELVVKSAPESGAPVPDKIFFFIGGFEPGINIDSVGVLWLTGGGGGIDELYDTIFKSGLPPFTLLLSMEFDVLKVLSARADLELSLRGFKVKVDELKIKKTDIVAIKSAQFGINWYPDFSLVIAASVDLLEIIEGGCYLVADSQFFEFFIRAILKIPKDVPLIGGLKLLQADFGASMERIWGVVKLLGLGCGICYYWGGDFIFGTGDNAMVNPTYPELLGVKDIPVGYNTETGQTLYMRVTNITTAAAAEIVDDLAAARPVLLAAGDPRVWSDVDKKNHKLDLGADSGNDFVFNIEFTQGGPATADAAMAAIRVRKPRNPLTPEIPGDLYNLNFYDETGVWGTTDASAANANLRVEMRDGVPGKISVSISITEYIAGEWEITTDMPADIILYNVAPLPEVSSVTARQPSSDRLEISWTGTMLEDVEMSFFATTDTGNAQDSTGDAGCLLGTYTCTAADANGKSDLTVVIPPELPSGAYYVRAMASKAEEMRSMHVAADPDDTDPSDGTDFMFNHTNSDEPAAPTSAIAANAGNLMLDVNVSEAAPANSDGYLVSVYEVSGAGLLPTDFTDMTFKKDASGNVDISVGGTYPKLTRDAEGNLVPVVDGDGNPVVYGLRAETDYRVGVKAFKTATANPGGLNEYEYNAYSAEVLSDPVRLRTPIPPQVSFVTPDPASTPFAVVERTVNLQSLDVVTFTTPAVRFSLTFSEQVASGEWYIDSDPPQIVTNADSVTIDTRLYDGDHTITFTGVDADGDRVNYTKLFAVDTLPPSLLVSTGGFFDDDGVLTLNAVTDSDSRLTVKVDGVVATDGVGNDIDERLLTEIRPAPEFDSRTGAYSIVIPVNPGVASHKVEVVVKDALEHESPPQSFTVYNRGLSNIDRLDILSGDVLYTGRDIEVGADGVTTATLSLMATTKGANPYSFVIDDPDLVIWTVNAVEGSATITQNGALTIQPGSIGMVTGSYRVAQAGAQARDPVTQEIATLAGEMTAALTFGASIFTQTYDGAYNVNVGATIGGTVSGQGSYVPGTVVTVTATPNPGYRFVGWSGPAEVTFADPSSATTTFVMPSQSVTVTAQFQYVSSPRIEEKAAAPMVEHFAAKGSTVSMLLPPDVAAQGSNVIAYYMLNGVRHIVYASAIVNGRLVFQAPVTGMFGYMVNDVKFGDTSGHWAENAIRFAAAREILRGVGEGRFDPEGQMTRAMFVTILSRLDGILEGSLGNTGFADVRPGSWYEAAVRWAKDNGIVGGVSPTEFDPDAPISREHMAIMLYRYIIYKGFELRGVGSAGAFNDGDTLSEHGDVAAEFMRLWGIMDGKPGNVFDGSGRATRAEGAVVLMRLIEALLRK